jgi:hypothetical protein
MKIKKPKKQTKLSTPEDKKLAREGFFYLYNRWVAMGKPKI